MISENIPLTANRTRAMVTTERTRRFLVQQTQKILTTLRVPTTNTTRCWQCLMSISVAWMELPRLPLNRDPPTLQPNIWLIRLIVQKSLQHEIRQVSLVPWSLPYSVKWSKWTRPPNLSQTTHGDTKHHTQTQKVAPETDRGVRITNIESKLACFQKYLGN